MTSDATSDGRPRRRTWLYVVGGLVMIFVMTGVALIVGGVVLFRQHIRTETMAPAAAEREFERATARLASMTPLIELRDGHAVVNRQPEQARQPVEALHLLVYDTNDGRLMNITIPGWLLRLGPARRSTTLRIDGIDGLGAGDAPISFEDLERHGPGLVIDGRDTRRGSRLLAWVD